MRNKILTVLLLSRQGDDGAMSRLTVDEYMKMHNVKNQHVLNDLSKLGSPLIELKTYGDFYDSHGESKTKTERLFYLTCKTAKDIIEKVVATMRSDLEEWTYDETWLVYRIAKDRRLLVFEKMI